MFLATVSPPVLTFAATLYLYFVPCTLGNFGYMYFPECSNARVNDNSVFLVFTHFARLLSPCLFAYVCLHAFGYCVLEHVLFSTLHCYCLINYLHLFFKHFTQHLESSNYASGHPVLMYRKIQLLASVYN